MAVNYPKDVMESIIAILTAQYTKCFRMMNETITRYDEKLWYDADSFDSPAWQVVYHALYCANRYLSPTEKLIKLWPKTQDKLHRFAGMSSALPKKEIVSHAYTKEDMLEYLRFIQENLPYYLSQMEPEERCWPSWYDEPQLEFHFNNIRHIQHHIGQANERQNNVESFDYWWYGE